MRKNDRIGRNETKTFSLPWQAEVLTIFNPTGQTVLVRRGSPSIPDDLETADFIVPAFGSMQVPVEGTEFGMRTGAPISPVDPLGQPYVWITFTAGELPPALGSVALSQVAIDSEITVTPAPGSVFEMTMTNGQVQVSPVPGSEFSMNIASADISLPVTGQQTVLWSQTLAKDAVATGDLGLPAGTVALAVYVNAPSIPASVKLWGKNAADALNAVYAGFDYIPLASPLIVPVSQNDDHIEYYVKNRNFVAGSFTFTITAVIGPSLVVAANLDQTRPFPVRDHYDQPVRHYSRGAYTSHAVTKRWTYTVPANCEAVVDMVTLFCDQSTSANQLSCYVLLEDSLGTTISYLAELWSKVGERQSLPVAAKVIMNEGEKLSGYTFSTDPTSRTLMTTAIIREMRKTVKA